MQSFQEHHSWKAVDINRSCVEIENATENHIDDADLRTQQEYPPDGKQDARHSNWNRHQRIKHVFEGYVRALQQPGKHDAEAKPEGRGAYRENNRGAKKRVGARIAIGAAIVLERQLRSNTNGPCSKAAPQ